MLLPGVFEGVPQQFIIILEIREFLLLYLRGLLYLKRLLHLA